MDVILHIGAHRTATTTFQAWMLQNADALAAGGIAYWGPDRTRAGLFSGLVKRPDLVTPEDGMALSRLRTALAFELDRLAADVLTSVSVPPSLLGLAVESEVNTTCPSL